LIITLKFGEIGMSTADSGNIRFARRVALKVKPEQIDNFLAKMRNEVFPNLRSQAGIRRMYLLRSPGENDFLSLTLWDNKSYADSYEGSDFRKNTEALRDMLELDPSVTLFDVDLHDVNAEDLPAPSTAVKQARAGRSSVRKKPKKKRKKGGRR
jgi:heme-degrading monooxygenase HmoA